MAAGLLAFWNIGIVLDAAEEKAIFGGNCMALDVTVPETKKQAAAAHLMQ